MTLLDFVRARLDDDEASEWPHRPSCQMLKPVPDGWSSLPLLGDSLSCNCDAATRWLAEIEAKRAIITRYEFAHDQAETARVNSWQSEQVAWEKIAGALELCVRDLTTPYAGHSDYDESWRP